MLIWKLRQKLQELEIFVFSTANRRKRRKNTNKISGSATYSEHGQKHVFSLPLALMLARN